MARRKITKRTVDAAKPGETIWDTELKGFGLRVAKGGAKAYVLKYRRGATQRWMKFGRHGEMTPEIARLKAKELLGKVAAGEDPAVERAEERKAGTFAEFADLYLERYSRTHNKPSSARQDEINLRLHILPVIGRMKVGEVATADLEAIKRRLGSRHHAANRCRSLLAHMFETAVDWRIRQEGPNPATRVKKFEEKRRKRYLSIDETRRLGRVLAFLDRKGASPYEVAAIRILLFTGCRLGEILSLKWCEVDFCDKKLRLSDSKTGEKEVPLSARRSPFWKGCSGRRATRTLFAARKKAHTSSTCTSLGIAFARRRSSLI